jgi:hypothetical protein
VLGQNEQGRQRVPPGSYGFIILVQTIPFPSLEAFDRMARVILLREVIAALEVASDDCSSYLDPDTGEIITVTEEERNLAEDESWEDAPEWQREVLPKIRAVLESDRFLELPDRFDIHEWSIMERFSREQNNERIRHELLHAIQGAGAFRAFRSAIRGLGMEQRWYQFRDEALAELARRWLEEHKLPYK